jgi:hypothetical protein
MTANGRPDAGPGSPGPEHSDVVTVIGPTRFPLATFTVSIAPGAPFQRKVRPSSRPESINQRPLRWMAWRHGHGAAASSEAIMSGSTARTPHVVVGAAFLTGAPFGRQTIRKIGC